MLAHLSQPRCRTDPSPGPRRLMKAPVAVHPLPSGEGRGLIPLRMGSLLSTVANSAVQL
jgi:hypothetical protein